MVVMPFSSSGLVVRISRAWLGASGANNNDYATVHNGSNSTSVNDGVNRAGTIFYKYGVSRDTEEARFYVDDVLRQTINTNLPVGNISIGMYSEINSGNVVVDWVRPRKIVTTAPTFALAPRNVGNFFQVF